MFNAFLPVDGAVAQWVAELFHPGANPFWDAFFSFVTKLGDAGLFWIALGLVLLIPNKTRKAGAVVLLAMVIDVIVTNGVLKNVFARPRPYDIDFLQWAKDYVYPVHLVHRPSDYSFPSGHTAGSFAGAFGLLFASRKAWNLGGAKTRVWAILTVVLAAVIGFSRIYLGVHYFTDVLAGAVVGVLCAAAALGLFLLLENVFDRINAPIVRFMEKHMPKILR